MISRLVPLLIFFAFSAMASFDTWDIPESPWIKSEMERANRILSASPVDLLVTPVEGPENRFDPIERSLMSAIVASSIRVTTGLRVADTHQVRLALGKHKSRYSLDEIQTLARDIGASRALLSYAEHDRQGGFTLTVTVVDANSGDEVIRKSWTELKYADDRLPSQTLVNMLPEIVALVTDSSHEARPSQTRLSESDLEFPDTYQSLVEQAAQSPLHMAFYLQFVGTLHPGGAFNETRNALYERSIVELHRVSSSVPHRRYLMARAYANLDRRPAALNVLGAPQSIYERALLDALNGNLTPLQALVPKLDNGIMDLFVLRDIAALESAYNANFSRQVYHEFSKQHAYWQDALGRALWNVDDWNSRQIVDTKSTLDGLRPGSQSWAQALLDSASREFNLQSEIDALDALTTRLAQYRQEFEKKPRLPAGALTELDALDLIQETLVADHVDKIHDDLDRRRLPQRAVERIEAYDRWFAGHPEVTLLHGRAGEAAADSKDRAQWPKIAKARETARNGVAWTGRMTYEAIRASKNPNRYAPERLENFNPAAGVKASYYPHRYYEWPAGSDQFFTASQWEIDNGALDRCLAYRWDAFGCLVAKIELEAEAGSNLTDTASSYLSEYEDRFLGNPERSGFDAKVALAHMSASSEIERLRTQVDAGIPDWSVYYSLGRALKRLGRYEEAQEVLLKYPAFRDTDRSQAVTVTSHAEIAASWFFWVGQTELARPLLEIAVRLNTYSAQHLSSAARIGFMDRDLETAEAFTVQRIRRYGSVYAMRDLMQLLHLRGESETAWQLFDEWQAQRNDPQLWSAALVGHKMSGATTAEIAAWINANYRRKSANYREHDTNTSSNLAPRYLLLQGIMDRQPGPQLAEALVEIRAKPAPMYYEKGTVSFNGMTYRHDDLVSTPPGPPSAKQFDKIPTPYEWFARSMQPLLAGDYEAAFNSFNETGRFFYLDEYLPYFALCAAKVGKADHLWAVLEAREPGFAQLRQNESSTGWILGQRFNEDLTYAVLHAFNSDFMASMRYLKAAFNDRPFTKARTMFTYYQVVDLAERLYAETGYDGYRDFALDAARRHTVIQPMHAWAFLVVATHSADAEERGAAARRGLELDPKSYRGSLLPERLVRAGGDEAQDGEVLYHANQRSDRDLDSISPIQRMDYMLR